MKKRLESLIEKVLGNTDIFLVDFEVSAGKVSIFLDGINGITLSECATASRSIGTLIEENDLIESKFFLEVSSPGLSRPLKDKRQYKYNINRGLRCKLKSGKDYEGKLIFVNDNNMLLDQEKNNELVELDFDQINEAKVII